MINRPIHGGYPDVAKGKATLRAVPPTKENPMPDAPAAPTLGEIVIGHRMHALHESAVAADEAREFLAATMEPQFPIEAEMARKGLHFILPASWAVEAIQSALESQSAEIARQAAQLKAAEYSAKTWERAAEQADEREAAANARNARLTEALRELTDLVERLTDAVERETHDIGGEGSLTVLRLIGPAYERSRAILNQPEQKVAHA